METGVNILPAALEHAQAIYCLMCELEGADLDKQGFQSVFEENLINNDVCYFIALWEVQVVGFSSLHVQHLLHHTAPVGEIQEIVVSRVCRGQGIGQALFESVKKAALAAGCVQLEVCCRKERKRSHDFYQKMGMGCSHDKFCLPLMEDA